MSTTTVVDRKADYLAAAPPPDPPPVADMVWIPGGTFRMGSDCHDMAGNVWEWTADWYVPRHADEVVKACCGPAVNPRVLSPEKSYNPRQPQFRIPRRVVKGGSHLCAPNYCLRYRPAARPPQMIDTAMTHIGFRGIIRVKQEPR
jgi:formylglycine-generating enzyme required for sulfatase activity